MTKQCFKCGEVKPISGFYRHPKMADGHLNKCKDCTKKDVRSHRIDSAESVRAYDRERAKRPEAVARRKSYAERYQQDHRERRAAHYKVNNAVRDGKLAKRPCAFCGAADNLEAHHHDYSRPLDVTWLCTPCHRRFHALERMEVRAPEAAREICRYPAGGSRLEVRERFGKSVRESRRKPLAVKIFGAQGRGRQSLAPQGVREAGPGRISRTIPPGTAAGSGFVPARNDKKAPAPENRDGGSQGEP